MDGNEFWLNVNVFLFHTSNATLKKKRINLVKCYFRLSPAGVRASCMVGVH